MGKHKQHQVRYDPQRIQFPTLTLRDWLREPYEVIEDWTTVESHRSSIPLRVYLRIALSYTRVRLMIRRIRNRFL